MAEENAHNLLDKFQVGRGERCGSVRRAGQLGGLSIVWCHPKVGRVFGFFQVVFEMLEHVFHIFGHVHVDGAVLVVPSQVDAAKLFSFPVDGDGVFISEGLDQMFGIFFADVFNSKVVHHWA